jgi:hypothetical protein
MAYNRIKDVTQTADSYVEEFGYASYADLTDEDIESIGMDTQCNFEGVCEILNIPLPESLGPVMGDA